MKACTYCGQLPLAAQPCVECIPAEDVRRAYELQGMAAPPLGRLRVVAHDPGEGLVTVRGAVGEPSYSGAKPPQWVCSHSMFDVNAWLSAYKCRGCGVVATAEDVEAHRGRNSVGLPESDGIAIRRAFDANRAVKSTFASPNPTEAGIPFDEYVRDLGMRLEKDGKRLRAVYVHPDYAARCLPALTSSEVVTAFGPVAVRADMNCPYGEVVPEWEMLASRTLGIGTAAIGGEILRQTPAEGLEFLRMPPETQR